MVHAHAYFEKKKTRKETSALNTKISQNRPARLLHATYVIYNPTRLFDDTPSTIRDSRVHNLLE